MECPLCTVHKQLQAHSTGWVKEFILFIGMSMWVRANCNNLCEDEQEKIDMNAQ